MADHRAEEELYDLRVDPDELHNLAADPAHRSTVLEMRAALERWVESSGDLGSESAEAYASDMEVYLAGRRGERREATLRNIELMRALAARGR